IFASVRIPSQEIYFAAILGTRVEALRSASLQLEQYSRFKCVSRIGSPGRVKHGNQSHVDCIGLARIHHALPLGTGPHRNGANQECVFEIAEILVQSILRDANALRAKISVKLVHAEGAGWTGEKMANHPPESDRIRYRVPFDHIAQQGCIYVAAQKLRAVSRRCAERLRESAVGEVGA